MSLHMNDHAKHVIDALAITTTVATIVQWLPSIAALLTVIWTAIRIYETDTIRKVERWILSLFKKKHD